MKKIVLGILAHVDAGKTTLSEGLLYHCGMIRSLGRVDHQDAFLDTDKQERARGITIFSKQAMLRTEELEITLLDTPGHVDFSAEMERTLSVLDYAILIISGADGVQGHTRTLWRLLEHYRIPAFIFVNKMDQEGTDAAKLMEEIHKELSINCVDFTCASHLSDDEGDDLREQIAVCDDDLLESYLESGELTLEDVQALIASRRLYPVYFGSALRLTGTEDLLRGIELFTAPPVYDNDRFGARIFKITRDDQGRRLTWLKVTGGSLKVKTLLTNRHADTDSQDEEEIWQEKADQLRIYSGTRYDAIQVAEAGTVCAVTGLTRTRAGQGLGFEPEEDLKQLEPVLNYRIILPSDTDPHVMLLKLRQLEEEEPELHIVWKEQVSEIHVQIMGEVQLEILKTLIWDRFHTAVDFDEGSIVYRETIAAPAEGVGHFEPLRHYAEVHLFLEPGERGSGLEFYSACSEDVLDRNWQRLIFTHLEERQHLGTLTGSPITDMRITLINGRAHLKHTEGGDFRQATYRAVRQGLKKAPAVLLEPLYEYRLELPADCLGHAMTDIQKMGGSFHSPEIMGDSAIITGTAPVSAMRNYQREVSAYTKGRGQLFTTPKGYAPCQNQEEIATAIGYDSESDKANPTGSVFCAHGAGFYVPWDQVDDYSHLPLINEKNGGGRKYARYDDQSLEDAISNDSENQAYAGLAYPQSAPRQESVGSFQDEEELQAIFERTFGPIKHRESQQKKVTRAPAEKPFVYKERKKKEECLLVDGYNILFAWEELRDLVKTNIDAARDQLIDILSDYHGLRRGILILVFDAYNQSGHREEILKYHNIYVVYTKEAETADQYIEKTVHQMGRNYDVTVATSDGLERVIIMGQGAVRMTASDLHSDIKNRKKEIKEYQDTAKGAKQYVLDNAGEDVREYIKNLK